MEKCKIKGCTKPLKVKKHGLCGAHLKRLMTTGNVRPGQKVRKYVKMEPFVHKQEG